MKTGALELESIESRVTRIEEKLAHLEGGRPAPATVSLGTVEPEPFELVRDLEILIEPSDDGFVASFFDANLSISGETQHEALTNLKALMIDVFERLQELGQRKVGPGPKRQLQVLRSATKPKARLLLPRLDETH